MSRFLSRAAAIMAAGVLAITLNPAPASAATAPTAVFFQESVWPGGSSGRITVTTGDAAALPNWRVEFDLPAGTAIAHHWNAVLTRSGNHYVVVGASWNASLAPGASTSFGWVATGQGTPQGCLLNAAPCDGRPPARDVRPPSAPTQLRGTTQATTFTLTWTASTDNTAVIGYEIYNNTGTAPIATVTTTSYSMGVPPPMVMSFGVRAVDAAGNRSPFAVLGLGTPPDTTAPSQPTALTLRGPTDGSWTVGWAASTDNQFVAGYEVTLNGTVISLVGNTTAYVPYTGYGTYIVTVRAFDAAGNFSTRAQIGIAVDPPPPPPPGA
ncbi:cellulose-binding domain-containing protein [Dactylosporangium sp. NBC_01737]|uniref:cellulose binding domain-containing protein n=1 Tax=Dactylosporangium sp. NBC_01737 TaxID=2975959 RepID=UPI002E14BCD0|nr:cellulose-binding domain-containing protein [Dactylosporangium sp. NBC_01737]